MKRLKNDTRFRQSVNCAMKEILQEKIVEKREKVVLCNPLKEFVKINIAHKNVLCYSLIK